MGFFSIDQQNEKVYLKWGFLAGVCLAIFSIILESLYVFLTASIMPEKIAANMDLFSVVGAFITGVLFAIIHALVLYLLLKKVDLLVTNMNKWYVAMYTFAGIWITEIIVTSIMEKALVIGGIGLLPVIVTLAIPALYKSKDHLT